MRPSGPPQPGGPLGESRWKDETTRARWSRRNESYMGFQRSGSTKSFNEPARVRMDGTRAEPTEERPGKPNTSYERYKQQLQSFFNGDKPLPDHLKDLLATRPGAAEHGFEESEVPASAESEEPRAPKKKGGRKAGESPREDARRRVVATGLDDAIALAEAIRKASSPREVQAALDALKQRQLALPRDAEILGKALGSTNEGILEEALRALADMVGTGEWKGNATLLKTRLKNVALLAASSDVRSLCHDLQQRLG